MSQFGFLHKQQDGSLQFQSFNTNAVVSSVYDAVNKALIVLLKHKYKMEVPVTFKESKGAKSAHTKFIEKDFEVIMNQKSDIKRYILKSDSGMTSEEIDNFLEPATIVAPADN